MSRADEQDCFYGVRSRTPPESEFASDSETLIEFFDDGPDMFGRRTFLAYWIADNVGWSMDEHGVRGQVFVTEVEKFTEREARNGHTVRIWKRPAMPETPTHARKPMNPPLMIRLTSPEAGTFSVNANHITTIFSLTQNISAHAEVHLTGSSAWRCVETRDQIEQLIREALAALP